MSSDTSVINSYTGSTNRDGLIPLRLVAALGAIAFSGVTWYLYQTRIAVAMIGVGITAGFGAYAILGTGEGSLQENMNTLSIGSARLSKGLASAFFLVSAVSMVTLTWGYYTKPIAYYLMIATAGAILFLRIVLTDAIRSNVVLAVLFGINTFGSNQIAFPLGMGGPDGGYHIRLVEYIMNTGHVTSENVVYANFPGQHLLSATAGIPAGLSAESTYLLIGTTAMTLGVLLTYSVAKQIMNERYGLISMLLYASMSYVIYRGGHPTQQAHILPIVFLLFLTTLYFYYRPTARNAIMFTIFAAVLTATHHHSSFQAGAMLVALYIGYRLFGTVEWLSVRLFRSRSRVQRLSSHPMVTGGRSARLIVLFGSVLTAHMIFTSEYFDSIIGYAIDLTTGLTQDTRGGLASSGRFAEVSTEQFLINTTGEGILLGLAVIGGTACFIYLNQTLMMIIVWLCTAGVIAVLGITVDFAFIIPQRVYVTAQMTALSFLAAFGLVVLLNRIDNLINQPVAPVAVLTVVVFALVFFSASSTIAGIETSPFNTNVAYGIWYDIAGEEQSAEFLRQVGVDPNTVKDGNVNPDRSMSYSQIDEGIISVSYHRLSSGILLSTYQGVASARSVIPESPSAPLNNDNKIYTNSQVELYHRA